MSLNQSRGDKNDPPQHRRSSRSGSSNQPRNYSGGGGGGKGGGGTTAPPSSLSSTRSYKKVNNGQGGQSRVSGPNVNVNSDSNNSSAARNVQNGAHVQTPGHGASDAPVTGVTVKPTDASSQKSARGVPKAPAPNAVTSTAETTTPATPAKVPADPSRAFPLQFGSISPGFMNGMQIPARTNSAPPNLDEQKRDQARYESLRAASTFPAPAVPKQQLPRKDTGPADQSNNSEVHPISKSKRDAQVSAGPPATQAQKPSIHPSPGAPMQMPFHQQQIPVQFGGPNPQMQSQGMPNSSLPMPMPMSLPMANPPQVQQPVFVPGIQPHPMQPQGIMHQNFTSQMSPQLPPHLPISLGPQYQQQQAGKLGGPRKAVKITHPETHEELRLDKRTDAYGDGGTSGPRPHPNAPPQSQPMASFSPSHTFNFYHNSYNPNPLFFPAPGSVPLTSTQIPPSSQPQRSYNQVTVKPAASLHGEKAGDSSLDKSEFPKIPRSRGEVSSNHSQIAAETISESSSQQSNSTSMPIGSKPSAAASDSTSVEILAANSLSSSSPASVEESTSVANSSTEFTRRETVGRSGSIRDEQKKPGQRGPLPLDQVGGQSTSISSMSSQPVGPNSSLEGGVPEPVKSVTTNVSSGTHGPALETTRKPLSSTGVVTVPDISASRNDSGGEGQKLEVVGHETNAHTSVKVEAPKPKIMGSEECGDMARTEGSKQDENSLEVSPESTLKSSEATKHNEVSSVLEATNTNSETGSLETAQLAGNEVGSSETADVKQEEPMPSSSTPLGIFNAESSSLNVVSSTISHGDKSPTSDYSLSRPNSITSKEDTARESDTLDQKMPPVSASLPEASPKLELEVIESNSNGLPSPSASGSKDRPLLETNKAKSTVAKSKKKRKEILKNADAQGTTSDIYMAYKSPEEKKEPLMPAESIDSSSSVIAKQASADSTGDTFSDEKSGHSKPEPEDWEDAADTPKLETSDDGKQAREVLKHHGENSNDGMTKKYSRDFLLKFLEQCTVLPEGFEITSDIAEALIVSNVIVSRDSYPSPGRNVERPAGGPRLDRRGSVISEDDKWNKLPVPLGPGRDLRLEIGYAGNVAGFRHIQGVNYGVSRNPRAQSPVQYAGGILSGPMQSPGTHGGIQRNNSDSDRWQRATAFQKGLIPFPQTPLQVMHKAERKYEVGKTTDEEQAKQRQLKGILNKLTPQNFEKLFDQVKQVNIDSADTLSGVISQIFDKALMEPTFCEMYANFCHHLAGELPDFSEDNEKITFKRLLLNKCQEEFERGEREEEEANRTEEEGEVKQSEEEREEKRIKARRRMLGNIRLIGELYKKKMLTERIMHECIKKLLGEYQNPDEEKFEALCKLMSTIGEMIDHSKAKEHIDVYFERMAKLSNNMKLSSRVRFMLKDSIDLRKNKWQQRRKVEGPKKIDEVHRDAAQERQAQSSRLARGPSLSSSVRRGQPMDFAPRSSNVLPSPNTQMGGFRGLPQQLRGYGNQDVRFEERHSFENRTLSIPLRPIGDDTITLGPQGGLARGMSIRGQHSMQSIPIADMSPVDSRRVAAGPNGYSSVSERTTYGSREELIPRLIPERFVTPSGYDQSSIQDRNMSSVNRDIRNADRSFDRGLATSPPTRGRVPTLAQNVSSEKVLPEERLRDMSMEAIKEFYSAKDEKEIALCIKDLNAPSFYPSMISFWVTDSFERKDMERDLLAKLLINLTKPQDGILSQDQLVKGFEKVLATLEDAVNDAPKAAEFLGRIFAKVLLENAIPSTEVWRLIYEGGEEQGRLVEIGLASEVLGVILETIKSERGDPFLTEMRASSNLHVENFRPPNSKKSWRIDKFI